MIDRNKIFMIFPTLLLTCAAVFLLWVWMVTEGFPFTTDQGEIFYSYLAAKNWLSFGLLENWFLEDHATSPDPNAHPYYYTHNPNFPTLIIYFFLRMGLTDIRWHIFLAIPVFLLGQWYFYRVCKRFLGEGTALWVLFFAVTAYVLSLSWGLNFFRAWSWSLLFGPIFHLKWMEEAQTAQSRRFHLLLFSIWLGLASYYEYSFFLFITIVFFALRFFRLFDIPWKRLLLFWLLIPGSLFLVRQILIGFALGWETWLKDLIYTLGNRTIGKPSSLMLKSFYEEAGLVLWGYKGYRRLEMMPLLAWKGLEGQLGKFPSLLVCLGLIATPFFAFQKRWDPAGWKFLASLSIGVLFSFLLLPYHFYVMYSPSSEKFPLLIFFCFSLLAFLITSIINFSRNQGPNRKPLLNLSAWFGVFLLLFPYGFTQYKNYLKEPPRMLPAAKVLSKYHGFSFITNDHTPYVNYFTQNWVLSTKGFFERDKRINRQKYLEADYQLCVGPCDFSPLVKIVEQDRNWKIIALRSEGKRIFEYQIEAPSR